MAILFPVRRQAILADARSRGGYGPLSRGGSDGSDDAVVVVSRATIPTMAGMVACISGVFANIYVVRVATRESHLLEDRLTTDH